MTTLNSSIKDFCKQYKMKLEKITSFGFIASILVDAKAGMEVNIVNGKLISIPIKKVGKRRVYFDMKVCGDGDISFGKQYKNNHPTLN